MTSLPYNLLKRHFGFKETRFENGQTPTLEFSVPAVNGHAEDIGYFVPGTSSVRIVRFQHSKILFSGALDNGSIKCFVPHVCNVIRNHCATTIQMAYRRYKNASMGEPMLLMPPRVMELVAKFETDEVLV